MFTVGITWKSEQRALLEKETVFSVQKCVIKLNFTFDFAGHECFPRKKDATTSFADIAVLTYPNSSFQTHFLSLNFPTVDFNWFSSSQSKQVRKCRKCCLLFAG